MKKYGKEYDKNLMKIKSGFEQKNDEFLLQSNRVVEEYLKQPKRKACKMCGKIFDDSTVCFQSHSVIYYYCTRCHHLNGEREETVSFSNSTYIEEDYNLFYNEQTIQDYLNRVQTIYKPKMDFLLDCLKEENVNENDIKVLDVGAGSGYFVKAGAMSNIDITGVEISQKQVDFGNKMLDQKLIKKIEIDETESYLKETKCNVISMIGVMEHLVDFHQILKTIKENKNIKFLYFSVPMFSFSSIFETIFQDGYNRHMSGDHTHLFTNDSIKYMNHIYDFKEISSWEFGTDMMDLYRLMMVHLSKQQTNKDLCTILNDKLLPIINNLQLIIDRSEFCSEIHMLVKK